MAGLQKFSYLSRGNLEYIEAEYQRYLKDPESADAEWRLFFEGVEFSQNLGGSPAASVKEVDVQNLIKSYRDYGHLIAKLNPLDSSEKSSPVFNLEKYNLSDKDLTEKFQAADLVEKSGASLQEIIGYLKEKYCGTLTVQVSGCEEDVRNWFNREMESTSASTHLKLGAEEKKAILESLIRTESLEKFIHTRYVGKKRFSVEGGDSMLPMLEQLVLSGSARGVEEVVVGMAHRGRVNVLANFMGKALDVIFAEFEGAYADEHGYDGDVKYHIGYSVDKETPDGSCHVSLAFNPSHLEAVSPVALGMSRAKQRTRLDTGPRKKVVPVLIHGDAAFAGQGVVSETLQLSQLKGYTIGGAIHLIANNQVGFTTDPVDSRSTRYSSDMGKSIKAPVILVNGDDVEACVRAMDMALRFRQEFGQDVVIDLICYRRFGHNEGDEPAFTQPLMYETIKKHKTCMNIYLEKLISEGVITREWFDDYYRQKIDNLQSILDDVRKSPPGSAPLAYGGLWKKLRRGFAEDFETEVDTRIKKDKLLKASQVLVEEPTEINVHRKVKKLIANRKKMLDEGNIDWGLGELMCYASLISEGIPVRLSGQDVKRGTFTHRHAVYFDSKSGEAFTPLKTIDKNIEFCIYNSPLSEMAVLGFEYGNASADPRFLTIWEAQFGDFANGAQIIIDQFIASGEQKWARACGLSLLLPHGYEGQGPEHSSARLERFLQLCDGDNMQVCNLTTPANLFHVFRRQMKRDFRKPLVIMSPKSLLRHPKVVSTLEDLTDGHFQEVIPDHEAKSTKVKSLVLCSGKLYYELLAAREAEGLTDKVALVRLEQLTPFPKFKLAPIMGEFPELKRVVWAQEEPKNMGAYSFVAPRIQETLEQIGLNKLKLEYAGRPEKASPATGSPKVHTREQQQLINNSLGV